jgi:hypothetical protein
MEFHQLITEKYNLFQVMAKYCESVKENIFDYTPITFYVEIQDPTKEQLYAQAMAPFLQFYNALENHKQQIGEMRERLLKDMGRIYWGQKGAGTPAELQKVLAKMEQLVVSNDKPPKDNKNSTKFKAFNFERKTYTKFTLPHCHFEGYNLWILKPTHLNRGRGIHVFRDLKSLHKLIVKYCTGAEDESPKKKAKKAKEAQEEPESAATTGMNLESCESPST